MILFNDGAISVASDGEIAQYYGNKHTFAICVRKEWRPISWFESEKLLCLEHKYLPIFQVFWFSTSSVIQHPLSYSPYLKSNMAPSLEDLPTSQPLVPVTVPKKDILDDNKLGYTPGRTVIECHEHYPHEGLLPSFPDIRWGPIEELHYEDRGLHGDPKFRNLLADATDIFDYTPKIGTEVDGVDLARLDNAQKDDLARLIAVRGVVIFRGQDSFDVDSQRELGKHFGPLHKVGGSAVPVFKSPLTQIAACYYCCSTKRGVGRCACRVHWR